MSKKIIVLILALMCVSCAPTPAQNYTHRDVFIFPDLNNKVLDAYVHSTEFNQAMNRWQTEVNSFSLYDFNFNSNPSSFGYNPQPWSTTLSGQEYKLNY